MQKHWYPCNLNLIHTTHVLLEHCRGYFCCKWDETEKISFAVFTIYKSVNMFINCIPTVTKHCTAAKHYGVDGAIAIGMALLHCTSVPMAVLATHKKSHAISLEEIPTIGYRIFYYNYVKKKNCNHQLISDWLFIVGNNNNTPLRHTHLCSLHTQHHSD